MKHKIIAIIALALISTTSAAGPNPFKDCGIGAALFEKTPWAAVTSNVIWDVGITAVISATASPDTCNGADYTAAVFINETYESLEQDLIVGEGEYINTLAGIMSCDSAATVQMTNEVRQNIAVNDVPVNSTRLEQAESLFLNVMNTEAAKSCAKKS